MGRALFHLVLWGQPPDVAERNRNDWESYLLDFSADHTPGQVHLATLKACASHVWWRATARNGSSTVPALLILGASAIALGILSVYEPASTTIYADAHTAVGGGLLVWTFSRTPWKLAYSNRLVIALLTLGTGVAHTALVIDVPAPVDQASVLGLVLIAIGCIGAAFSAIVTKTPFGTLVHFWWTLAAGMTVAGFANMLNASQADSSVTMLGLAALGFAEFAFLPQLLILWCLAKKTNDGTT